MSTVPVWVLLVVAIIGVAGPLGAQGRLAYKENRVRRS
jgi:hypothetical protein